MNCVKCHEYRISPIVAPGGGFFCKNNHGQCITCNKANKNRCNICQESTLLVKMVVTSREKNSLDTAELGPKHTGDTNDMVQQKMRTTGKKLQKETDADVAPPNESIFDLFPNPPDLHAIQQQAATVSENRKHLHTEAPRHCDKSAVKDVSQQQCKKHHLENSITQNLEMATGHNVTGDETVRLLTKVARKNRQTRTDLKTKIAKCILKHKQHIEILERALKRIELKNEYEHFLELKMQCKKQKLRVQQQMKVVAEACEPAKLPVTHTLDRKPTTPAQEQHSDVPANAQMPKPSQRHHVIASCEGVHHIALPSLNLTEQKKILLKDDDSNRLESILKTIKEEDKVLEDEESMHRNVDKVPKKITFKSPEVVTPAVKLNSKNIKKDEAILPICHRAAYKHYTITKKAPKNAPKIHGSREYFVGAQSPQMEPLQVKNCATFENIKQNREAEQNKELYFNYRPIKCPAVDCRRSMFISDLSRHIVNEHRSLTMERILSHRMNTFLFDTNLEEYNTPICQIAYFVQDKNVKFGSNEFATLLPVVLMAGKTHCNSTEQSSDTMLMIWLTGIVPENANFTATITSYPIYCNFPELHTTSTCTIYSMHAPQDLESIRLSGCSTILHSTLLEKLTDNGKELLGLQVVIN